jgi:gluconolactonase
VSARVRTLASLAVVLVLCGVLVQATPQASKPVREFALQGDSPDFWKLIPRDAKLTTVASRFGFTEGPVWDPAGFLYISDETLNKIFRVYLDGHRTTLISLGDPDGNTLDRRDHLLDCASALRAIIEITPEGKHKVLAGSFDGKRFNSPNDVVIGPDGAIYFTDPTLDLPQGQKQEVPYQGVYRLDEKGSVRLLTKELSQPNGLGFSPDGKKFYVDDSEQRNIRVYDFGDDSSLTNGRIFGSEPGDKDDGVPDGMKLDEQGNLYVTGPRGVWIWDAAGHHLGTIVLPEQTANLAWGDNDYRTLYFTASTSVYRLRTAVRGFVPYLATTH